MPRGEPSAVITVRVATDLERRIAREARRRRRSKSALVREAIERAFAPGPEPPDPAVEARRQSILVSGRPSEREALRLIEQAADLRGWK